MHIYIVAGEVVIALGLLAVIAVDSIRLFKREMMIEEQADTAFEWPRFDISSTGTGV